MANKRKTKAVAAIKQMIVEGQRATDAKQLANDVNMVYKPWGSPRADNTEVSAYKNKQMSS